MAAKSSIISTQTLIFKHNHRYPTTDDTPGRSHAESRDSSHTHARTRRQILLHNQITLPAFWSLIPGSRSSSSIFVTYQTHFPLGNATFMRPESAQKDPGAAYGRLKVAFSYRKMCLINQKKSRCVAHGKPSTQRQ